MWIQSHNRILLKEFLKEPYTTMYPNCFRYVHRDFAPVVVLEHTQAQEQRSTNLIWIEPQEETEGHCNW